MTFSLNTASCGLRPAIGHRGDDARSDESARRNQSGTGWSSGSPRDSVLARGRNWRAMSTLGVKRTLALSANTGRQFAQGANSMRLLALLLVGSLVGGDSHRRLLFLRPGSASKGNVHRTNFNSADPLLPGVGRRGTLRRSAAAALPVREGRRDQVRHHGA